MADVADVKMLGQLMRELQAQMRTLRDDNRLLREELATKVTRDELFRLASVITDRFGELEAHTDNRLDDFERRIEEQLTRIEKVLTTADKILIAD